MTAPLQIAFLTGQSAPPGCALSPAQASFLDALDAPMARKVGWNFPYRPWPRPFRRTPLLRASLANARQYLGSRRPEFRARHRQGVLELLAGADRTLFLAGSCGLELLANLGLPREALRRTHVFAYGPVARRVPACDCLLVQGREDCISRLWFRRVDVRVDCGHLGYLRSARVLAACQALLDELERRAEVA
jgi:hypothetical protein